MGEKMKKLFSWVVLAAVFACGYFGYQFYVKYVKQNEVLKQIITRLEADSRIAEVLVTDVKPDPAVGVSGAGGAELTTIKFLEYDTKGNPLKPKYFTFKGNTIQFQSLVVRFDDSYVKNGDALRGRSAYLFWKAFILEGAKTQEFEIAQIDEIPAGYKIEGEASQYEKEFWKDFWRYALDVKLAKKKGIKNAQLEAPGTRFIPGMVYTLRIEHDGGIRIDAQEIPAILKGEKVLGKNI